MALASLSDRAPSPTNLAYSPIADKYVIGVAVRKRKAKPRKRPASAVVIHWTGPGLAVRLDSNDPKWVRWREKWPNVTSLFEAGLWVYTYASPNSGHYLVGGQGECAQVVPEDLLARHVGSLGSWRYRLPKWAKRRHAWWHHDWPEISSPIKLAGGQLWRGGSCNANTIGIEVSEWTQAARATLAMLVLDICYRHRIPCSRSYVVRHSDAHPLRRTLKSGEPSDPREGQWQWDRFADVSGAPT